MLSREREIARPRSTRVHSEHIGARAARKLRGGKSIRTVVNDGRWRRQGGGLHSNEIQRSGRNRKRPDRRGPPGGGRGGERRGEGERARWSPRARVFFYSQKTRIKSYVPSSILSYLPDPLGVELGYRGRKRERERERERGGRFSHSGGPFIETNGLVRLFLLVPSSSLSSFIPRLPYLHDLPVSVPVRPLPPACLPLWLYPIPDPRTCPFSVPFPISSRASFFASSSSYASHESARITYPPLKDAQGST